jgi:predicted dehydrogenase
VSERPSSLRCAVVGLGLIGRQHAAALAATRDAEVVLCVDIDPNAERHVPSGAAFSDDIAALAEVEPDAVVVATPEPAHRAAAEAAFAAGAAVLCEKPLASSLEDADGIIELAGRAGGFLAVAHTLRFDPRYRALRGRAASGELGDLVSLSARRAMSADEGRIYAGRTTLALCLGIHDIDVIRWVGGEIVRVYAEAGPRFIDAGSADSFAAVLKLRSGAVATLDLGWGLAAARGVNWDTALVVAGTISSGYVEMRGGDSGDLGPELTYATEVAGIPMGVLRLQDEHFVRSVRDPSLWPGAAPDDARRALELALALDESAAAGVAVDV